MKDLGIFGTGLHASSFAIAAENRVNCYYEVRKDDPTGRLIVRGTPGAALQWEVPLSPIRGWIVVNNLLYVVAGGALYSVSITGTVRQLATLATASGRVGMADSYTQICIVDGAGGYVFTIGTGVLATIGDTNFPNGATSVCCLSSRFLVEKPNTREFYMSAALDGLTWTFLSIPIYATKEQYSDPISVVGALNGVLILWGTKSIEFWQDVGTSPNPFGKIQGATQTYGLAAKYSIAALNNDRIFLGQGPQGGFAVLAISGSSSKRISTSDIEDLLATLAAKYTLTDAVGLTYSVSGHDFYQLTLVAANTTILFSADTGVWSRVQTGSIPGRHFADTSIRYNNQILLSDASTGSIYLLSSLFLTDHGTAIYRQVTTKELRNNGAEFAVTELKLEMDTGQVPLSVNCRIGLEVSRDGGRTFGSSRARTLGLLGQYRTPRVKWDRMGSARSFVFRFTMTDPVPFVIPTASIETTVA